ncbi:3'-5' exonuclease domain-containing protein 2 [Undibacterium sp. LX40W]|uniref:3'-5' exonuclease domain-containing protein 2 n=1 Tax=Undibacterium nitidum TaxID=2762298 RepID=A0A923HN92_9BURK|nr:MULTISPECIES: 3'-5' exonuclease [Undibacterium]MBC3881503.1 3'-5' exonuclease domain-containing protein 2 [Undibacterium nitidum]MBC3891715.1 3'-5' exonuclease domain-containing protein 2 [Undibacterium sp. LX40W]
MSETPELQLPSYAGIPEQKIILVSDDQSLQRARLYLTAEAVLGFDTESKPVFMRGQDSDGPHLVQLATPEWAFLFPIVTQAQVELARALLKEVLESPDILKVGFGLGDDNQRLLNKLGVKVQKVLDLSRSLSTDRKRQMGAKAAVEKYFGQVLQKSKRISTSNWSALTLNQKQLKYAADDAQSALLVYLASLQVDGNSRKS